VPGPHRHKIVSHFITRIMRTFLAIDAFRKSIAAFGGLDIMVNNAGVFNDRFWEFEVDVNLVTNKIA